MRRSFKMIEAGGSGLEPVYCKLDGDLAAATSANFSTASRPSATASVWISGGSDTIVDSTRNITVVNRFGIAYTTGTMGIAQWMGFEWIFIGDCDPL
jgi:hypothetical protein